MSKWRSPRPSKCDLCGHQFSEEDKFFYDFLVGYASSWALGCECCFKRVGVGLGVGKGQKYDLATLEKVEEPQLVSSPN